MAAGDYRPGTGPPDCSQGLKSIEMRPSVIRPSQGVTIPVQYRAKFPASAGDPDTSSLPEPQMALKSGVSSVTTPTFSAG